MKIWSLFLVIIIGISTITEAEEVADRATELMKMGQSSLEQKEYVKARYLLNKHMLHFLLVGIMKKPFNVEFKLLISMLGRTIIRKHLIFAGI